MFYESNEMFHNMKPDGILNRSVNNVTLINLIQISLY